MRLPEANTRAVTIERDVRMPMPDGVVLLADRYVPRGGERLPVVLVRSPYGRRSIFGELWARPFAERGFQVLMQSVRGTFGSGGSFEPHIYERSDGLASLDWIKAQPWFSGAIFTFGQSYLGYTQWSIARDAGPELKAMALQITSAHFANMTYAGGSFMLQNALGWTRVVSRQHEPLAGLRALLEFGPLDPLSALLRKQPALAEVDAHAAGQRVQFFQDWLAHASPAAPYWEPLDFQRTLSQVQRPICMIAGWDDIFTPWQLQDYAALQARGCDVRLVVGPWKHLDLPVNAHGIREALAFFHAQLTGDRSRLREKPVRLYLRGARQWRDYDHWPPREAQPVRFFLKPHAGLSQLTAADSAPDQYTFDPADPTPALGGPSLSLRPSRVDNQPLEARVDVLTYTSEPLPADLDVIGQVTAELWVSSDAVTTDFFVRLCEVNERGESRNVCDGLLRVRMRELPAPEHGAQRVLVPLWPTAQRFRAGRRLRVSISGGAYPRWAVNPGTEAQLGAAAQRVRQTQTIHHDTLRASAIVLPVVP